MACDPNTMRVPAVETLENTTGRTSARRFFFVLRRRRGGEQADSDENGNEERMKMSVVREQQFAAR